MDTKKVMDALEYLRTYSDEIKYQESLIVVLLQIKEMQEVIGEFDNIKKMFEELEKSVDNLNKAVNGE